MQKCSPLRTDHESIKGICLWICLFHCIEKYWQINCCLCVASQKPKPFMIIHTQSRTNQLDPCKRMCVWMNEIYSFHRIYLATELMRDELKCRWCPWGVRAEQTIGQTRIGKEREREREIVGRRSGMNRKYVCCQNMTF